MSQSTTKPEEAVVGITETVILKKFDGDGPDAKVVETLELTYVNGELVKREIIEDGTD